MKEDISRKDRRERGAESCFQAFSALTASPREIVFLEFTGAILLQDLDERGNRAGGSNSVFVRLKPAWKQNLLPSINFRAQGRV
jgi:hypothetical protein